MRVAWIRDQFTSDALLAAASRVFDQQSHVMNSDAGCGAGGWIHPIIPRSPTKHRFRLKLDF
jgi:hypothetical protein